MVRLEAERDAALLKAGLTRADLVEHVAAGSGISAEEERALRAQVRKRLRVIVHTHTLSYTPGLSLTLPLALIDTPARTHAGEEAAARQRQAAVALGAGREACTGPRG